MSENYCGFEVHELALVIPEMREDEFEELKADIKAHGIRDQIVTYEGKILDGRHRYKALEELGIELTPNFFSEYDPAVDGKSPQAFVLSCNLKRRHLSKGQLAAFAADMPSAAEIEKARRERSGSRRTPPKSWR
jgi:ParB-like nuclease domain